ncbi:MAG: hypothetical protein O9264_18320 [Leptospira sp.]|nr:hypothetical protein [Leptospira sp.]
MIKIFAFLPLTFLFITCDLISPKESDDRSAIIGLVALSRTSSLSNTTTARFPTPSCEVSTPAFSTLKDAGFESTCGQSGCHITGGSAANKFRASLYSEVLTYVNSGVPSTSLLYREQSTGSMSQYTTQAIDKAIYCWILGGAKQ